jgi:D-3-phosphoglycerate dehydrogenase
VTRKIVVAEEIAPVGIVALSQGFEVVDAAGSTPSELAEHLVDAAALVVRSATQVTAELLGLAPKLEVVGRAGVGVDNIDLVAATAAGVLVVNAPDANTISAAEHTFGLLLAQARNIGRAQVSMRDGGWDRAALKGVELHGKTLGIIGFGRIGQLVATRAVAFGMTVIAYDPYVSEIASGELGTTLVELDELFDRADFITIHLPKTPETTKLISTEAIAKMKDGVRIVNTSRGGIVDEAVLVQAVLSGKVASAGLDVYEAEPLDPRSPLRSTSNIVLTPHLGASTIEAQDKAGVQVADAIKRALAGEIVHSAVNILVAPIGL